MQIVTRIGQEQQAQKCCERALNWNDNDTNYVEIAQKKLYEGEQNYIRLTGESKISELLDNIKKQGVSA